MFNRLEVRVLPPGSRWAAQLQLLIDGEDVVAESVGEGGRGPFAEEALPTSGHSRHGGIVEWSDWQVPGDEVPPPVFHFEAGQYDAEVARASADRSRRVSTE
jgi:hypothetical protein